MKIFVATPVFDGKLPHQTVECLMLEQSIACKLGDEIFPCFIPNCSHPAIGRNQLVQAFIDSDSDRLVFLDADITFEPGAIIKIAKAPFDFAAACTVHKTDLESYPIGWLPNKDGHINQVNRAGFIEIAMIGTAFMSLSRKVFDDFKTAYPNRGYQHYGKKAYCYFQTPFVPNTVVGEDGSLYGEDTFFCKEWRAAGGKIYLKPDLEITHWDFNKPFVGNIGKWLKNQIKEERNERESLPVMALPQDGTCENHPQP